MIYRTEIPGLNRPFKAPKHVTFGWQQERGKFSVWHLAGAEADTEYIVVDTGTELKDGAALRATTILPDGFFAFHLVELPFWNRLKTHPKNQPDTGVADLIT